MATCPCALTRQELVTLQLVSSGYCTAPDVDGNPCGRRYADHPFSAAQTANASTAQQGDSFLSS